MIRQSEVHWFDLGTPKGSEPAGRRPALVVQHDRFNSSLISTIVVAAWRPIFVRRGCAPLSELLDRATELCLVLC